MKHDALRLLAVAVLPVLCRWLSMKVPTHSTDSAAAGCTVSTFFALILYRRVVGTRVIGVLCMLGLCWDQCVSDDLVTWKHLPPVVVTTPGWYKADGCFSSGWRGNYVVQLGSAGEPLLATVVLLPGFSLAGWLELLRTSSTFCWSALLMITCAVRARLCFTLLVPWTVMLHS
jgi:hypothetical protein